MKNKTSKYISLFQKQDVVLNSGKRSEFKIECDALTDEDLECLSHMISKLVKFKKVFGVPTGGYRLADFLEKYTTDDDSLPLLMCDDVLTTGGSMERMKEAMVTKDDIVGAVIFARGKCPEWITPLFLLNKPEKFI